MVLNIIAKPLVASALLLRMQAALSLAFSDDENSNNHRTIVWSSHGGRVEISNSLEVRQWVSGWNGLLLSGESKVFK